MGDGGDGGGLRSLRGAVGVFATEPTGGAMTCALCAAGCVFDVAVDGGKDRAMERGFLGTGARWDR